MQFVSDIVEENGKTVKENNLEKVHKFPHGMLVELESGERLYVCDHTRDCDGEPLYGLCMLEDLGAYGTENEYIKESPYEVDPKLLEAHFLNTQNRVFSSYNGGHSEESLKVIK